jgi:hypothetical protein
MFFDLCGVQQYRGPPSASVSGFVVDAHLAYLDLDLDIIYPDPSLLRDFERSLKYGSARR